MTRAVLLHALVPLESQLKQSVSCLEAPVVLSCAVSKFPPCHTVRAFLVREEEEEIEVLWQGLAFQILAELDQ